MQIVWLGLLTLAASMVGTATGFGTSTVMVPVMTMFAPLPVVLLFVGIIHLFGDVWKMLLFKKGFDWKLAAAFVVPGVVFSFVGARISAGGTDWPLKRILGAFLIAYVVFLFIRRDWKLPKTSATAVTGGTLSGLFAGIFGVGGAVRGAFLSAYDLPKSVYIFTSGLIAFFIDVTRLGGYVLGGTRLSGLLWEALLICIPVSLIGAFLAQRLLVRLPQKYFRLFIGIFLIAAGVKLLLFP